MEVSKNKSPDLVYSLNADVTKKLRTVLKQHRYLRPSAPKFFLHKKHPLKLCALPLKREKSSEGVKDNTKMNPEVRRQFSQLLFDGNVTLISEFLKTIATTDAGIDKNGCGETYSAFDILSSFRGSAPDRILTAPSSSIQPVTNFLTARFKAGVLNYQNERTGLSSLALEHDELEVDSVFVYYECSFDWKNRYTSAEPPALSRASTSAGASAVVRDENILRLGLVRADWNISAGVLPGEDSHGLSWSLDLFHRSQIFESIHTEIYSAPTVRSGDVFGVLINASKGIKVYHNGEMFFSMSHFEMLSSGTNVEGERIDFYPVFSFHRDTVLKLNTGSQFFQYRPGIEGKIISLLDNWCHLRSTSTAGSVKETILSGMEGNNSTLSCSNSWRNKLTRMSLTIPLEIVGAFPSFNSNNLELVAKRSASEGNRTHSSLWSEESLENELVARPSLVKGVVSRTLYSEPVEESHPSSTAFSILCTLGHHEALESLISLCQEELGTDEDMISESHYNSSSTGAAGELYDISIDHHYSYSINDNDKVDILDIPNSTGETPLHIASRKGYEECVEALIAAGAGVSIQDKDGNQPLHSACRSSCYRLGIIWMLVARGADVNTTNNSGMTPLSFSCETGHSDIVHLLLASGANPNIRSKDDMTPLCIACSKGFESVVKELLNAGAEPMLSAEAGINPLYIAEGSINIVHCLIRAGADVNWVSDGGASILYAACHKGNLEKVKALVSAGAIASLSVSTGLCPLHVACERGFIEIVNVLLQAKSNVDATTGYSDLLRCVNSIDHGNPLITAGSRGYLDIVKTLIAFGANVDVVGAHGRTVLIAAASNGHVEIVKELLNSCTNINNQNDDGYTALNVACKKGFLDVVNILLNSGSDASLASLSGISPFLTACEYGFADIVRVLLAPHVSPNAHSAVNSLTEDGYGPINAVCRNGSVAVMTELLRHGADVNIRLPGRETPLYTACLCGHIGIVETLLREEVEVNSVINPGVTALYAASNEGHSEIVGLLLSVDADPLLTGDYRWTALYAASRNGHRDIVKQLLAAGADANFQSCDGWTPLMAASDKGHSFTVQTLLKNGANPGITNKEEMTPLFIACNQGHLSVVQVLLKSCSGINRGTIDGITPLRVACDNLYDDIVQELLGGGADINYSAADGTTPLYSAARAGSIGIVRLLLKAGANLKSGPNGWTPFYVACWCGFLDVVKELLAYGASIAHTNDEGWSPLMAASFKGQYSIVRLLLKEGADIDKVSKDGSTALTLAKTSVSPLLLDAAIDRDLLKACIKGDLNAVKTIMSTNKKNFPDFFSEETAPTLASKTPFMVACSLGLSNDFLVDILSRNLPVGDAFGRGPQFFDFKNNDLSFPSVRYNVPIYSHSPEMRGSPKVYFECRLRSRGVIRVGIASAGWYPQKLFHGVGNDDGSYGLDGWQGCVWHSGSLSVVNNVRWDKDQIIGVTIDTAAKSVVFHRNGVLIKGIPEIDLSSLFSRDEGIVPVCSFDNKMEAVLNFGSHAFQYPPSRSSRNADSPPDGSAEDVKWMSVDDYYREYHCSRSGMYPGSFAPPRCLELYDTSIASWKAVTSASRLMRPCPAYDWCWAVSQDDPRVVRVVSRILEERQSQVWELSVAEDENGRKAIDIAAPTCKYGDWICIITYYICDSWYLKRFT